MKRFKRLLSLAVIGVLPLTFTGCSIINNIINGGGDDSDTTFKTFSYVTDDKLVFRHESYGDFYSLTLNAGETYQVKTDIDEDIKNTNYYLSYTFKADDNNSFTVSETGLITAKRDITGTAFGTCSTYLLKKGSSRTIHSEFISVKVQKPQELVYANITLTDASLEFDSANKTYELTLTGGDTYTINTRVNANVTYALTYELTNSSYSSFMSVSASGVLTTQEVTESITGKITIKTKSEDATKTYDTVYLMVYVLKKTTPVQNKLTVVGANGSVLSDGDTLTMYKNDSMTFSVKFNNSVIYNCMTVSDSTVLELTESSNTIKGLKSGTSEVTFAKEDQSLTVSVTVNANPLTEINARNGGDDLLIVNDNLLYIGKVYAKYQSGYEVDITNSANLTYQIANKDANYKSVTLSYSEDGVTKTVTYNVKYFTVENYTGTTTAYDFEDYYDNYYNGASNVLTSEGTHKVLAVPVWFTNSTNFFREDQKSEILEDLNTVLKTEQGENGYYSVEQYYEIESSGKVHLDIHLSTEFYNDTKASTYYGDNSEDSNIAIRQLATSVVNWYFDTFTSEQLSDYDINGDNKVDALILLYGANYYGTIGDSNRSDAFEFINQASSVNYKTDTGSFCPIGGIYGFNKRSTSTAKDFTDDLSQRFANALKVGSRTIIHETGHMFGFADLYETQVATDRYYPAGHFSMQDSNLGGHDPYHLNVIGWTKPQVYDAKDYSVGETITVKIDDYQDGGQNILLTNDWNEYNSLYDEYLLLELFAPTGLNKYDANINIRDGATGIRLWHVNSLLTDLDKTDGEGNALPTQEVKDGHRLLMKYSNYEVDSEYDLLHWIRNNPEEEYNTLSTINNDNLFGTGDSFDIETYKSQFVNQGKLDNKEKLGWTFEVNAVYQKEGGSYSAIITLTRVDNTKTEFTAKGSFDHNVDPQPTTDGSDYANEFLDAKDTFSMIYNFNNATPPSYYTQGNPITYKGLCLFAASDGNGGSLVLTILDKEGKQVSIKTVTVYYSALTNAALSGYVNDAEAEFRRFSGPKSPNPSDDPYNMIGMEYQVNAKSITLKNKYNGTIDYKSLIDIYKIEIEYVVK